MDIRVFKIPNSQDYQYPKVEQVKDDKNRQKKDDEKKDNKKKKDEKVEGIFSSLAESLGQEENFNF